MPDTLSKMLALSKITIQSRSSTAAAASSAAINQNTRFCRVTCDQDCYVTWGPSPQTATTSSMLLRAGQVEYLAVKPGWVISVIRATADGTLSITECE